MRHRITWGKGLNVDVLPSELSDGFASGAENVRFAGGFAQRVNGWGSLSISYTTGMVIRYLNIYRASDVQQRAMYIIAFVIPANTSSTSEKARIYTNSLTSSAGAAVDVTPADVAGAAISSITWDSGSGGLATVTTSTAHGLTSSDSIGVSGVTPAGYNATSTNVFDVPSTTTFRYPVTSDPGGAATVVGSYTQQLSRDTGLTDANLGATGGTLGGISLVNMPYNGLYYWNGDTSTDFALVAGAYKAAVSRVFKNFIVQLGLTISGVSYKRRLGWSTSAEPGTLPASFTASATNDAGDVELAETNGELVDCMPLGDVNYVFLTDSRYAMRYIGGNDVFQFTRLPGVDGLFKAGCVVNTPVGQVFLTAELDLKIHQGGESRSIAENRVRSLLRLGRSFSMAVHSEVNELWVNFERTDSADRPTLIWNWVDDTWGIKNGTVLTITNGNAGEFSDYKNMVIGSLGSTPPQVLQADVDDQDNGVSYDSEVERSGLDFGEPDLVKNLQRSRWNIDGVAGGTFSIEHGASMTADGTPSYASAATYTLGTTDYVSSRAPAGRYLAVKCSWTTTSTTTPGKVRSTDLDATAGGKR